MGGMTAAGGAGGEYLVEETNWEGAEGKAIDGETKKGDRRTFKKAKRDVRYEKG